ncbi:MAG: ABC transporter ATP-binding protein [Cellulosilyticaceae bacterium]
MKNNKKLVVCNLSKNYDGVKVLEDINFEIETGEFVSILGPSGCGKTTILRILIGLEELTKGEIYKDGQSIKNLEPSDRGMGIVFQSYALFPNMNVLQNVMYPLIVNKKLKNTAKESARELLEKLGLGEHLDKMPNELSGGQKQRVAIARTMVLKPDIILLDEALSALDIANKKALTEEFKYIQSEFGVTMVYITHDQEEAFSISDKIIVMSKGKVEQIGSPKKIFEEPVNDYVDECVNSYIREKMNLVHTITRKEYV